MGRPVNERQLEVLRWIADDCPSNVMEGSTYKTTAVALKNRGLVKVTKRGGWTAELTDAGRFYLEHERYPDQVNQLPRLATQPKKRAKLSSPSVGEQQLAAKGLSRDILANKPAPATRHVGVPQGLSKPHPLVVEIRDSKRALPISKNLIPRALRIIHGLAVAFENEGWTVASAARSRDRWGKPWDTKDLFVVDTGEVREGIRIGEENDRSPHVPTPHELRQKERWSYTRIPEYDYHPSGRIYLEIDTRWDGRRHRWSDRQRWTIEEKLGQLLDELRERSDIERQKRMERERREAEWQVGVNQAVAEAKVRLRESHRRDVLQTQADSWSRTEVVRRYLEAMRRRIESMGQGEAREQAEQWLYWCEESVETMDPLNEDIGFPDEPDASPEALRPFLPDWVGRRPTFS